jgi:hypothetical protein
MANPNIIQGTLNRLIASVVYADFPELNINSGYLSKEGISIAFEGDLSQLIPTMTGAVTSPEPYVFGSVTIHLLRSQFLASQYKGQIETDTTMGSVTVIPDSIALTPYQLENCVLQSVQEMTFDGNQAGFIVKLRGVYQINGSMYF